MAFPIWASLLSALPPLSTPKHFILVAQLSKTKNPRCCEEFGQVAFCLVHLWSCELNQSIAEIWRTQGQRRLFFWHHRRVTESPPLLPHLFLIHTWQQWCAQGTLGWLTTLFSQGIILANGRWGWAGLLYSPFLQRSTSLSAFSLFFFLPHRECANNLFGPGYSHWAAAEKKECPMGINYSY